VMVMVGGEVVFWRSQRLPMVVLSTAEAELASQCSGSNSTQAIADFINEIGVATSQHQRCDAQAAIMLTLTSQHWRTRHLHCRARYLRELIMKKFLTWSYCPTKQMRADILTKALAGVHFWEMVQLFGLSSMDDSTTVNCKMMQVWQNQNPQVYQELIKASVQLATYMMTNNNDHDDDATTAMMTSATKDMTLLDGDNNHKNKDDNNNLSPFKIFGAGFATSTILHLGWNKIMKFFCGKRNYRVRSSASQTETTFRRGRNNDSPGRFHYMGAVSTMAHQMTTEEEERQPNTRSRYDAFLATIAMIRRK
jgi:hypothetical protein